MSVTAQYVLHKAEFEPIVKINDYVGIMTGRDRYIYGKVIYIEPVQPTIINLGPLPAASASRWPGEGSEKTIDYMKLGEKEFGQWRLMVLDDILLEVSMRAGMPRWLSFEGKTYASRLTLLKDQLAEIYTYEDIYIPTVKPYNPLFREQELARILVMGYRYVVEEVERPPAQFTAIPVIGMAVTPRGR